MKKKRQDNGTNPKKSKPSSKASHAASDDVQSALAITESYIRKDQQEKIPGIIEKWEEQYPFGDSAIRDTYDRLLAIGLAHQNRLSDAERIIMRGLEALPHSLDLLFVLAFVKLSLREFSLASDAAQRYNKAYKKLTDSNNISEEQAAAPAYLSQLQNMHGAALRELQKDSEARSCFELAIEADPGNHLPYLNLSRLLAASNQQEQANEITTRGIKACNQVADLRLLQKSQASRPRISACMIVRDEEELLPDCLASIRDWIDEIIIVDTGSKDRTIEIAESYGAKLFHQTWEDDFSKHRNYSLDQATGDWLFIIDADERVVQEDLSNLLAVLRNSEESIVSVNVFNVYGKNEETTTFLPSIRFFKRSLNLKYEGIVHNRLTLPENARIARTNVRIKHLGYDLSKEKMEKKLARSRALLEKQLQENPDNAFALFNYAQLLRGEDENRPAQHAELIFKSSGRALELTDPDNDKERHIHIMCLNQLAWTHFHLDQFPKALDFAERALAIKPNYLDPLLLKGHIHVQAGRYIEADQAYRNYLEVQSSYNAAGETDNIIVAQIDARVNAHYALAMIAEMRPDAELAKKHYNETLRLRDDYLEANARLGRVLLDLGDSTGAQSCFQRQMETSTDSQEAVLGLAYIYKVSGRPAEAENCYRQRLQSHPDDSRTIVRYGQFCLEQKREDEAGELFNKALQQDPDNHSLKRDLADIYLKSGKFTDAIKVYQNLLHEQPDSELMNDLGNCYFKLSRYEEAADLYIRATKSQPVVSAAWRNLGLAQARLGKRREAIDSLSRFVELEPEDRELVEVIGDLHRKLGEHESAIACYEQQLRHQPNSASALTGLSECYLLMGHRDSAILGLQRALQFEPDYEPAKRLLALSAEPVGRG